MKLIYLIFIFLSSYQINSYGNEREDSIYILEKAFNEMHEKIIKEIPNKIKEKILSCKSPEDIYKLDIESQEWLFTRFAMLDSSEDSVTKAINNLKEFETGESMQSLLLETFWCKIHNKPFELTKRIELIGIRQLEDEEPSIKIAPEGQGNLTWIWKLEVKDRPHGIIHVGIDEKTRRFLCYERTIGIYYPEGDTLERIRAEIVQDPIRAGAHLGKGRMESKNNKK